MRLIQDPVVREYILPYENFLYGATVKGNFYIRRLTQTYRYKNPLLGEVKKMKYTGILYVVIQDANGWKSDLQHILIPNFFNSDEEFLNDAYQRYYIETNK